MQKLVGAQYDPACHNSLSELFAYRVYVQLSWCVMLWMSQGWTGDSGEGGKYD
tara:strand:+ start:343 stop:501 length:159 start_codon:yes stop_codon:yes gene_type:complete